MRILIGCLGILLTCSCSQFAHPSHSGDPEATMKRREQVREIVFGPSSADTGCEIRGPLTIAQVKKEMNRRAAEDNRTMKKELGRVIAQLEKEVNRMAASHDQEMKKEMARVLRSIRLHMRDAEGESPAFKGPEWRRFSSACEEGGEVYYVKSGPQSWRESCGSEMYVTIRENNVSGKFGIGMN